MVPTRQFRLIQRTCADASGPPGCGKGTQSPSIKYEHCLCHLATGDILRAAVAAETALGKEVSGTSGPEISALLKPVVIHLAVAWTTMSPGYMVTTKVSD